MCSSTLKYAGTFLKKSLSQQLRRVARLPNYFHGSTIQTLNFEMTLVKNQARFFQTAGHLFCAKFVLISQIFEKFCNFLQIFAFNF